MWGYMKTRVKFAGALGSLVLVLAGCENGASLIAGNSAIEAIQPDPANSVCDPFGGSGTPEVRSGLYGQLYTLSAEQPRYEHVADYLKEGTRAPLDLFFNQIDVPTRAWDKGFVTQDGTTLKNNDGETLYEWFAVHLDSKIRLGDTDQPGYYQFAVLSDDGSILRLDADGNGLRDHIDNDGTTPTRLRCGTSKVRLDANSRIPMTLDYFQGPRYHIAFQLLWRRVSSTATSAQLRDSSCDKSGNDLWFDSNQTPSVAQAEYRGLLNRGWKVLGVKNFQLPEAIAENPCAPKPGGPGGGVGI